MGTSLELQIVAESRERGQAAEAAALREIDRLEEVFSAYNPNSELCRWQKTIGPATVSPELAQVLLAAEDWRQRTDNAFHPAVESLTRLWRDASEHGTEPDTEVLAQTVREMQTPLWDVDTKLLTATRRTRLPVTLNAIAKGFIVDRACFVASEQAGVRAVLVNIGGDICQRGGSWRVGRNC